MNSSFWLFGSEQKNIFELFLNFIFQLFRRSSTSERIIDKEPEFIVVRPKPISEVNRIEKEGQTYSLKSNGYWYLVFKINDMVSLELSIGLEDNLKWIESSPIINHLSEPLFLPSHSSNLSGAVFVNGRYIIIGPSNPPYIKIYDHTLNLWSNYPPRSLDDQCCNINRKTNDNYRRAIMECCCDMRSALKKG